MSTAVRWDPALSAGDHYLYGTFTILTSRWEARWRRLTDGEDFLVSPLAACCGGQVTVRNREEGRAFACGTECANAMEGVLIEAQWLSYMPPSLPDREAYAAWIEHAYGLNALQEEIVWATLSAWNWDAEAARARETVKLVTRRLSLA